MATTVIIPARNEEKTIGEIVNTFNNHPSTARNVYVFIDAESTDQTARHVWQNGGCAIHTDRSGKGQVVATGLAMLHRYSHGVSNRLILCDGDYTGLTAEHITRLLKPKRGMAIGIPDFPEIDVPKHVITAWPHISGFRCLPYSLIPEDAHGYMLETQINQLALKRRMLISKVMMHGLHSPFTWPLPEKRMRELRRDQEWATLHGVL